MATRSWNRVELIGNLTRDPELRFTPSGAAVCTFSIATNRSFVTDGERREEADFHRVVSWNKLAELCNQLLKKGNRVFVSGRLQNRSWQGQDGQQRQTTEIVIEDMIVLTSLRSNTTEAGTEFSEPSPTIASDATEDVTPAKSEEKDALKEDVEVAEEPKEDKKPKQEDPGNLDDLPF